MPISDGSYKTTLGLTLIAKLLDQQGPLVYDSVTLGGGTVPDGTNPEDMTDLANYVMDGIVVGSSRDGQTVTVSVQVDVSAIASEFVLTELALWSQDPDDGRILDTYIAMENSPMTLKPTGGSVVTLPEFDLISYVGAVPNVNVVVDPYGYARIEDVQAVRDDLDEHINDTVPHVSNADRNLLNTVSSHVTDNTVHVTSTDRTKWDNAVTDIAAHKNDIQNPHEVNYLQVGADPAGSATQVQTILENKLGGLSGGRNLVAYITSSTTWDASSVGLKVGDEIDFYVVAGGGGGSGGRGGANNSSNSVTPNGYPGAGGYAKLIRGHKLTQLLNNILIGAGGNNGIGTNKTNATSNTPSAPPSSGSNGGYTLAFGERVEGGDGGKFATANDTATGGCSPGQYDGHKRGIGGGTINFQPRNPYNNNFYGTGGGITSTTAANNVSGGPNPSGSIGTGGDGATYYTSGTTQAPAGKDGGIGGGGGGAGAPGFCSSTAAQQTNGTNGGKGGGGLVYIYANVPALVLYTVIYNGNGNSSGAPPFDFNAYPAGTSVTVLGQGSLSKTLYTFLGWNTNQAASSALYTAGQTFTITGNTTLYAIWQANPFYGITYDANGGSGYMSPSSVQSGATYKLPANQFEAPNWTLEFDAWNTQANGNGDEYLNESSIIISAPVTLYAQWRDKPTYTIYYEPNGGSGYMEPDSVRYGSDITLSLNTFTRSGFTFKDWAFAPNPVGGPHYPDGWTFAPYMYHENITLWAQWQ